MRIFGGDQFGQPGMGDTPPRVSATTWARGGKRLFDAVAAAMLLILLSPLALATALLVKLTSRGPILFVQERTGLEGHAFKLLKFRTMRADRVPNPAEIVPLSHADVTRVGLVLRRFKIDEMPQLIHVLTGQMSLVGPRPTLPDQTDAYDNFRRQRLLVRPGITGLAQIHGNTVLSWDQRILFDIAYVRRSSFLLDLLILIRTCWAIPAGDPQTPATFEETRYARYVTPPEGYETLPLP